MGFLPRIEIVTLSVLQALLLAGSAAASPAPVQTIRAETGAKGASVTVSSNLMVDREVAVTARVSGIVDSIQVERGAVVRAGQALATLDQREFLLDRRAADENFKVAEADYKRYQELFNEKLASKAELEQRRARYEEAKVDLEKAKLVIDRSVVRAPFDGVVVDRSVKIGEKVLMEESKPLFRISALGPLEARGYLPEALLRRISNREPVRVRSAEFPDVKSTGRLRFVAPVIDPASGMFQVVAEVDRDPEKIFRPGMSVKVTIPLRGSGGVFVPAACLAETNRAGADGSGSVFELADGKLQKRRIQFLALDGGLLLVRSGLAAGAVIVQNPSPDLHEGESVRTGR
jgi:membrane fusion protein (multidrug efflux system)